MSNAVKYHIAITLLDRLVAQKLLTEYEYADAKAALVEQYDTYF